MTAWNVFLQNYYPPFAERIGEVFVLLYVFLVFLFGQRCLENPRADSRQSLHADVAWVGTCLLPFWGLAAPGGREKGQMKFSLLWESTGNFCILAVFELARIHTKYYLCRDNVCRRALSPCVVHRPLGTGGGGVKNSKTWEWSHSCCGQLSYIFFSAMPNVIQYVGHRTAHILA